MATKKDELTTISKGEIEQVPEFLQSEKGSQLGLEQVEQGDLLLPRLGICQALSPQRRKTDSSYIEGLVEGQLFNTVTNEIYGEELEVYMLFFFRNRMKFFPIDEGGGIDCLSANGIDGGRISPDGCSICKFSHWGNGVTKGEGSNDAPLCTMYANFLAMTVSDLHPLAISYKSTGLKISKKFLAEVRLSNMPMFAKKYKICSTTMRDGSNEWFEKKIITMGFVKESEIYNRLKEQFESMKDMAVTIKGDDTSFEGEGEQQGRTEL
jgi:hypothetical protein